MVPKVVSSGKSLSQLFSHIFYLNGKQTDVFLFYFPRLLWCLCLLCMLSVLPVLSASMDNLNVLNAPLGNLETYLITLNVKIVVLVITLNQLVHTQQPRVLNAQ